MPRRVDSEGATQRVRVMQECAEKGGSYTDAVRELAQLGDNISAVGLRWWAKRNPKYVMSSLYESLFARSPEVREQASQRMNKYWAGRGEKARHDGGKRAKAVRVVRPAQIESRPASGWLPTCLNCGTIVSLTPEEVMRGIVDHIISLREQGVQQSQSIATLERERTDLQAQLMNMEHVKVKLDEREQEDKMKLQRELQETLK